MIDYSVGAIDTALIKRLLVAQFPRWADLPLKQLASAGTDNMIYRLGNDMVVRLPRSRSVADNVDKEFLWLSKFLPLLPLVIPAPLAKGSPTDGFPFCWSVYRWIDGEEATTESVADSHQTAFMLGHFVAALQGIPSAGGPISESRGMPLIDHDVDVREALMTLHGVIDVERATVLWDAALRIPAWQGLPVWLHGDLHPGNLLINKGLLNAVIDFGLMCVGDPAYDLLVAWSFLLPETRDAFRAQLSVDDATWMRGRAWALAWGLIALAYYLDRNPVLAGIARRTIDAVLADGK